MSDYLMVPIQIAACDSIYTRRVHRLEE